VKGELGAKAEQELEISVQPESALLKSGESVTFLATTRTELEETKAPAGAKMRVFVSDAESQRRLSSVLVHATPLPGGCGDIMWLILVTAGIGVTLLVWHIVTRIRIRKELAREEALEELDFLDREK
jgi:hypothetical protein